MKHASIRQLFDYWNERRGLRAAPERADIEPGAIRRVLADTYILAFDPPGGHPFRIAGTRVCAAFGRELKNEPFVELWRAEDRALIRSLIEVVARETTGLVASARAVNSAGDALDFEVLALPLKHRGRTDARLLGALAPSTMPYWFGIEPLGALTLGSHRHLGAVAATAALPRLAPTLPEARLSHGFLVYDGGQS
jgi:hypothetical protein